MDGYFLTHRGKVRNRNEDAGGIFYNSDGQMLAIVADGMGGHQAGDVASDMAASFIQEKWKEMDKVEMPGELEKWMSQIIAEVNAAIFEYALNHPQHEGMGTTVVMAVCTEEFITIAHIGDSRCYLLNEDGLAQITEDHSLVNELVRSGQISKEDAEHHPRKNILLKALGTEQEVSEDVQTLSWEKGDQILLCSDGLTNKIIDEELKDLLSSNKNVDEIANEMLELANDRGGEDNITLAILRHNSSYQGGGES
jgi:protein phosphatase